MLQVAFTEAEKAALPYERYTIRNDTYINAPSVCELLRRIAALGLTAPITLVLDNARHQKCHLVRNLVATLNIELLFFANPFAKLKAHREALEIRQEKMSLFHLLRKLHTLHKRHLNLPRSNAHGL